MRRRRATANRVLTYLKAALNQAWRAGLVPSDDAWRRVKPFRSVDAPVIRYLSHDEITRLLNACQGAFRDLVHAALLTGCRYGELCRLKIADYNLDVETLTIREPKNGRVHHVTLTGEGPELIERFLEQLKQHDTTGAALTMQEYQSKRPSLYDFEAEWAACLVPSLIIVGDEDDLALQPSVWLKRTLANAGLLVTPKTGHTVNLEDPEFFNRVVWDFIALVEAGRWTPRPTATG